MIFFLIACAGDESPTSTLFNIVLEEYHELDEPKSWTYRDDMPVEPETLPDESQLLLAKNEDGYVAIRRGSRWADAQDVGHLSWDISEGLRVLSWELPFSSSDTGFLLTDTEVEVDSTTTDGGWSCTLKRPDSLWTWYAEYQDVLQFHCIGSSDIQFFFGKRAGLVLLLIDGQELELVAPW